VGSRAGFDLASQIGQEHLEDLVPENRFQLFQVQRRSDPEHLLPVKHPSVTGTWPWGLNPKKSPKVWMAMTVPG